MAKVQQKSERITAFGGIFFVLDKFDRILSSVIDSHLNDQKNRPHDPPNIISPASVNPSLPVCLSSV